MYESRARKPLSTAHFVRRFALHLAVAMGLLLGSLLIGMAGYRHFEGLAWRDGFLNSAMLLGGMGPVDAPRTDGGKVFAGLYALYAGLVFIVAASLIFAPVMHRILHKFHWDEDQPPQAR
ncbi:MAG TPA: hypothetical protein VIO81_14475 [Methyloversatilis sp.]